MSLSNKLDKYKLLLRPLILVLVLDVVLLFTNYMISADLEASAVAINVAGRQRMLSQKMTKSLAFIELAKQNGDADKYIAELYGAVAAFNQTIDAFYRGGIVLHWGDKPVLIKALVDADSKEILMSAKQIWMPIHVQFQTLLNSGSVSDEAYADLLLRMRDDNLALLTLMDDLTNHLENDAEQRTHFLRIFQTIIVVIIFLSFLHAVMRFSKREAYYAALMEKTTDVVMSIDIKSGRLTFVSVSAKQVLGYEVYELVGNTVGAFMTQASALAFKQLVNKVEDSGSLPINRCEAELIKADGSIIHTDVVLDLTLSEEGVKQELSADFRDISDRKSAEKRLAALAHKDPLTGLSNRHTFLEVLAHAIQRVKRSENKLAVLFIDLDGFKSVNDSYGHESGDALLIELAARMKQCLRQADHIARMGGDEFIVLLEDVKTQAEVEMIAEKLLAQIAKPYAYDDHTCNVTASIGCAFYTDDVDASELINQADKAMYEVKFKGKNAISFG